MAVSRKMHIKYIPYCVKLNNFHARIVLKYDYKPQRGDLPAVMPAFSKETERVEFVLIKMSLEESLHSRRWQGISKKLNRLTSNSSLNEDEILHAQIKGCMPLRALYSPSFLSSLRTSQEK